MVPIFFMGIVPSRAALAPLEVIAYEGKEVPGMGYFYPDLTGNLFRYVTISDQGTVVFMAGIMPFEGDQDPFTGIFRYVIKDKSLTPVVVSGQTGTIPGWLGLDDIDSPRVTPDGDVLFFAATRVPGTEDDPDGRPVAAILREHRGRFSVVASTEEVVSVLTTNNTVYEGHFSELAMERFAMNRWGVLVVESLCEYYLPIRFERDGFNAKSERIYAGIFRKAPGSIWTNILNPTNPVPGGGSYSYYKNYPHSGHYVGISDSNQVVIHTTIWMGPGEVEGAILQKPWNASWQSLLRTGQVLTNMIGSEPNEFTISGLANMNLNIHGQIGIKVYDTQGRGALIAYSDQAWHCLVAEGDESPTAITRWSPHETMTSHFSSIPAELTYAMNNNRFPLKQTNQFLPEVVFQSMVTPGFYLTANDLHTFTMGQKIYPILLGKPSDRLPKPPDPGTPLPEPPGGTLDLRFCQITANGDGYISALAKSASDDAFQESKPILLLTSLDRDGDGLLDIWETEGIDINPDDANIDLDLKALGADPDRKDVFLEIDYMTNASHKHKPAPEALQQVIEAFAQAPVDNPCGTNGIVLHIDMQTAEGIPHTNYLRIPDGWDMLIAAYFGTPSDRSHPNRLAAKRAVFRYCIFGHQFQYLKNGIWETTTASGLGEFPGNDFLVTLGAWTGGVGSIDEQAGTLMHELGHNLGLAHGGDDHINAKPNYLSVMSYSRQFSNMITNRPLDYSSGKLPDLDETNLFEMNGIGAGPQDRSVFFVDTNGDGFNETIRIIIGNQPVDWNQNTNTGDIHVSRDINSLIWGLDHSGQPEWLDFWRGSTETNLDVLRDFNDWAHIQYSFRQTINYDQGVDLTRMHLEMDWETYQALTALAGNNGGRPRLHAMILGNEIQISWTTNWAGYELESTLTLDPPGQWHLEVPQPVIVDERYLIQIPISGQTRYFRLRSVTP